MFSEKESTPSEPIKQISFRNVPPDEQVPKILDLFMDDFEKECLEKKQGNAKNYSIFSVTSFKIIRTIESGKKRGLLSAHTLNRLNKMFVKHPVMYSKQAIRDPLGLVFVITELAIDIRKNLSVSYEFEPTLLNQIMPIMQRYYVQVDDAIGTIMDEFSKMPKFKLMVQINEEHKKIIQTFLNYSVSKLPLEIRVNKAKEILEKILNQEEDSISLEYYNNLKLTFSDNEIKPRLSKIAKEMPRSNKRFVNTILDEVSTL